MHLSKPLFFLLTALLISGVSLWANAAENFSPSPDLQSLAAHQNATQSERPNVSGRQFGLFSRSGNLGAGDANVCYTMRSYKVKRTERLADNESGVTGYSTCEMASTYRLRSTEREAAPKLK